MSGTFFVAQSKFRYCSGKSSGQIASELREIFRLGLPELFCPTDVFPHTYTRWANRKHTKIDTKNMTTGEEYRAVDHWYVYAYGSCDVFEPDTMRLIDATLLSEYPAIFPNAVFSTPPSK